MPNDLQHVYLPKLFGGPFHGKRMAFHDPFAHAQFFASPSQKHYYTLDYTLDSTSKPVEPMMLKTHMYLRQDFKFGRRLVHAFIINTKSGEEAFEMVCNYLLRDAVKC